MTEAKPGRLPCLVIGCRRTAPVEKYPPHTVIICGKCWRLAPKHLRRRVRKIERIGRKLGIDWDTVTWEAHENENKAVRRVLIMHAQAFNKLVKAATDVKVGIG